MRVKIPPVPFFPSTNGYDRVQVAIITVGTMNGNRKVSKHTYTQKKEIMWLTLSQMKPSVDSMKLFSCDVTSGNVLLEMGST